MTVWHWQQLNMNLCPARGLNLLHCLELEATRLFSPEPEDAGMARLRETLGRTQKLSLRSRPAAGFWAVILPLSLPLSLPVFVSLPLSLTLPMMPLIDS